MHILNYYKKIFVGHSAAVDFRASDFYFTIARLESCATFFRRAQIPLCHCLIFSNILSLQLKTIIRTKGFPEGQACATYFYVGHKSLCAIAVFVFNTRTIGIVRYVIIIQTRNDLLLQIALHRNQINF